jgi:hypothetical protein
VDGAWFAIHAWSGDPYVDVKMEKDTASGYYKAEIPAAYNNLLFVRLNPAYSSFDWAGKWNQTGNLALANGNNLYTIASGAWDKGSGNWSKK